MHIAVLSHCPAEGCPNDLFKQELRDSANICCRVGLVPRFVEFLAVTHENNNVHNLRVVRALVAAGAVPPQQLLHTDAAQKVTTTAVPRIEPLWMPAGAGLGGGGCHAAVATIARRHR
jgi:hypothetical protein